MTSETAVRAIACLVLLGATLPSTATADCTTCHAEIEQERDWAHSYSEWERSRHAHNDVTCVTCHGGDSETGDEEEAHRGLLFTSRSKENPAHMSTIVADGCGNCHPTQSAGFRQSPHFKALTKGKAAADCTTCHGELGTRLPSRRTFERVCRHCHKGERLNEAMGVARVLMEHLRQTRAALNFPEWGEEAVGSVRKEMEESMAFELRAMHELTLEALELPSLAEAPHCVACHASLNENPTWIHTYQDWEGSIHANFDISCVNCHGGDARASKAKEAHSNLYFTGRRHHGRTTSRRALSESCGTCHPDQIAGFRESPHYRALKQDQHAADCTTCHGAVEGNVLNPKTITDTCRRCHPDESPGNTVEVARTLLDYTHRVRMALVFPEPGQRLKGEQRDQVDEAVSAAMAAWHEFDLEAVGLALAHGTGVLEK